METRKITKLTFIEAFKNKKIVFFTGQDVKKIFNIKGENTLKHLLRRLKKDNIIKKLIRDKYLFQYSQKNFSDYAMANFLVIPSYISLESALSFYGVIEQFPYRIISITLKKTKEVKVENKLFIFSHINKNYFKDFERKDDFLIATYEKAIFDYLYFIYKGFRSLEKIEELANYLKEKSVRNYLKENSNSQFRNFIKKYVKL